MTLALNSQKLAKINDILTDAAHPLIADFRAVVAKFGHRNRSMPWLRTPATSVISRVVWRR